ncbi:MAG: CpsD/CapB family tyrosine-protein kinase, partial [Gammaproteobacteria bacterium]|nr:CpsD/CapB family tyrosine-protein kinase [Gammaproteobacteria bacterium]
KALMDDLTNRYESRLIIFDLPALLVNDDALAFTPDVDSTLLVVEDGATTPQEIDRCLQLLEGTNLIGTVLNKAD